MHEHGANMGQGGRGAGYMYTFPTNSVGPPIVTSAIYMDTDKQLLIDRYTQAVMQPRATSRVQLAVKEIYGSRLPAFGSLILANQKVSLSLPPSLSLFIYLSLAQPALFALQDVVILACFRNGVE